MALQTYIEAMEAYLETLQAYIETMQMVFFAEPRGFAAM
jgi:hypothetical protein